MRKMIDSGIEWIGEIPENWDISRIGNFYYFYSGDTLTSEEIEPEGDYPVYGANGIRGYYHKNNLEGKNLLLGRVGALCGNVHFVNEKIWVTEHSLVAVPFTDLTKNEFMRYLFEAMNLGQYSRASAQPVLSSEVLRQLRFPLPLVSEQLRIANYLDSKCSLIDSIISRQEVIIEKLKEYKFSVITEAVTKGLNPDVEMKSSGSIWFGNIPSNWKMKRLKYMFHIQKDIAGKEGYTVLSITQRGIVPKDFSNNEGQFAESYANYQLVHKGNFAMNHMDLLTGWVDISQYEGVTSPDYRVFVLDDTENNNPEYYLYMMQMCYSQKIFYGLGAGVSGLGRWRLQADKFLNFWIPIPPKEEQEQISNYIKVKVEEISNSIDKRRNIVEKLRNFKKSLIYEVVTGKKEV